MTEKIWNVVVSFPVWVYAVLGVVAFYATAITLWAGMMRNAREMEANAKKAHDSPLGKKRS